MIVIDGSFGEGGGQILRTSIAMSALLLKPIRVINIRAKRSNPGLRRQHMTAIEVLGKLTDAEIEGLHLGSKELTFIPKRRRSGSFYFDIGTAGSISLVLQAALPVLSLAPSETTLTIKGGTDVPWSPPIDYLRLVFLEIISKMGIKAKIHVLRRGHYPKGGGEVKVHVWPTKKLKPLSLVSVGELIKVKGVSHCVKLPKHVAERQAKAAREHLVSNGIPLNIIELDLEYYPPDRDPHLGPGSGIVLVGVYENSCVGSDALGERGKPAEIVGKEAANKLLLEIRSHKPLDLHMADMILPYIAIADGISEISASKLTLHAYTNMHVIEKLTGVKFKLLEGELDKPFRVKVKGLGITSGAT